MIPKPENNVAPVLEGAWPVTSWTLVADGGEGAEAALEALCQKYRQPIYLFFLSRTRNPTEAEDLTQEFQLRLLRKNPLARVDPAKGRFRHYLSACLRNFLSSELRKVRAPIISLDPGDTQTEPLARFGDDQHAPDRELDRLYALRLIESTFDRLRAEYASRNQSLRYEILHQFLPGKHLELNQRQAAEALGLTPEAVSKAVHDMRKHWARICREQVAETVGTFGDLEDEIAYLMRVFTG